MEAETLTSTKIVQPNVDVLDKMLQNDHEQVVFCNDKATGLKAIIGIHNTTLGPALGGTRMWNYANNAEAIEDVLRLSRGMTYKASIAGLNLGGGKAVIIGDSRTDKSERFLRRFGKFVDSLNGKYITAEDVGMSTADMELIRMETKHVTGLSKELGGSGDPSPVTAYGVYIGMKASAKFTWGNDDLNGRKVLVQGVGHVGQYLVGYLLKENADVYISDIYNDKLKACKAKHPEIKIVDPNAVYSHEMDIYAPCALGATLNDATIPQLKCQIVAGAANNQLENEHIHGNILMEKGITYAPDFLINSGGLINVYYELKGYNQKAAMQKAEYIYGISLEIFRDSKEQRLFSGDVALQHAKNRIEEIAQLRARL